VDWAAPRVAGGGQRAASDGAVELVEDHLLAGAVAAAAQQKAQQVGQAVVHREGEGVAVGAHRHGDVGAGLEQHGDEVAAPLAVVRNAERRLGLVLVFVAPVVVPVVGPLLVVFVDARRRKVDGRQAPRVARAARVGAVLLGCVLIDDAAQLDGAHAPPDRAVDAARGVVGDVGGGGAAGGHFFGGSLSLFCGRRRKGCVRSCCDWACGETEGV